jgi:DNA-binding transcriptional LysR family regulator
VELRQLAYLDAVIETGTFAAAAEREHIAQPALWSQVRALEREWGVPLFERTGRRVRPTAALLAMRDAMRGVLADARRLGDLVEATRTGRAGPVRVPSSTYPQVARYIAEAIAEYAVRYPDAPLPMRVPLGTAVQYEALARGDIDLMAGVPPTGYDFESAPLREVSVVATGKGITGGSIEIRELAARPLALFTPDYGSRRLLDAAFRREHLNPRIVYEDGYAEALVVLAERGVATAVLVNDALPVEFRLPTARVRDRGRPVGGQLRLLWRDEATLSTAARRFRDVMLELAAVSLPRPRPRARVASRPRRPRAVRAR